MDSLYGKYNGLLTNEELLKEYKNDENYTIDSETMNGSNIPTEEIEFNFKSIPEALKNAMLNGK
jgi:hypothetical protein